MALTKQQILDLVDFEVQELPVPEWDTVVHIRTMSGSAREAVEALANNDHKDTRATLVIHSLCDEQGNLIFEPKDLAAVNKKNGAALERIGLAALKLNKMLPADHEELVKN